MIMSLFCIADLHLSLGTNKPMDVFAGWENYTERLEKNWNSIVKDTDTVVIAGDISWAMKLEECYEDFSFINSTLNGNKILLKGNHDYWWATKKKMDDYLQKNGFDRIKILFNNSYSADGFNVCGTRGWDLEINKDEDEKVLNRELGRLRLSLQSAKDNAETIVFLHYPPLFANLVCEPIIEILNEFKIKKCYYGHLHGRKIVRYAFNDDYKGIKMRLISLDAVRFTPVLVC